ncbi:Cleavage/polyadenylation specificity factor subunit 5 [Papiliotrema laurentii]|uniref:Cleavage and polyadenylation specificity factor subunit 5 n=1 Tax=Papiliotrema laurentii TaxID=5418 RepID=A0AAD9FW19_PAPLA|nr:Cleavage/polyadenylation specificity factor subunit 5 [Papiliotrema laurentii]
MTIDVDLAAGQIPIWPLGNYRMVERESQPEEDTSVTARLTRLEKQYEETGLRRSVDAVMIVQVRGFPHILVLQVANAFYKLPGGYLDPNESDEEGLVLRLNEQLGIPVETETSGTGYKTGGESDWHVRECLSVWWRPNFDTFMYPYLPPHITEPKECKKLYLVELPPQKTFAVPLNMKLHAIPVMEFYDNAARYGPQFAGLPYLLSR